MPVWPQVMAILRHWRKEVGEGGKGTQINLEVGVGIVGGRGWPTWS